jgi:hypothetical protein
VSSDYDARRSMGTYRFGVKLITGEIIWMPTTKTLFPDQVTDALLSFAGAKNNGQAKTHYVTAGEGAAYFIAADNILYHVIRREP